MRPPPNSRHFVAALLFAAVSAASGYLAMYDDRLSTPQVYAAVAAIKRHQPDLFPHDPVFGQSKLWLLETPALQGPLELVLIPTGYQDLSLPFRALTGVLTMLYLCGMYALLYRQCRSWSISVFVAIVSAAVTRTLGNSSWGIGSLAATTPEGLCLAVMPLVVTAFLHYASHVRLLMIFAFVGLLGNLHLETAMNLAIVLTIAYLGMHRFSPSSWPMAVGGLVCAFALALPSLLYYLGLQIAIAPVNGEATYGATREAFEVAKRAFFYPDMITRSLKWPAIVKIGLLAVASASVLLRIERFRVREPRAWVWFLVGSLFAAFGLHGICQLAGLLLNRPPPVIGFFRAASLILLPLYVLLSQALTNLFRLVWVHRNYLRWACAAFLAVWMLPSDNLRVARHAGYNWATAIFEESSKPLAIQRHHARRARHEELHRIAEWAQKSTDPSAVFLTDESRFRMLARRAIAACRDDVDYFYYLASPRIQDWTQRVSTRISVMTADAGRTDPGALKRFVDSLAKQDPFRGAKQWYAILPAPVAPKQPGPLKMISSAHWGQYYVLCRIR